MFKIVTQSNPSGKDRVDIDDAENIARFISTGESDVFCRLIRKYQSDIRQFLRRLTAGDRALADDLAQDTFLTAFQKICTYKGEGHFKGWLLKIAYRRFLRSKQVGAGKYELTSSEFSMDIVVKDSVETDMVAEKMMNYLEVEERMLITLNIAEGMSHGEISQHTGLPLGTVKSLIRRSKQKLIQEFSSKEQVA